MCGFVYFTFALSVLICNINMQFIIFSDLNVLRDEAVKKKKRWIDNNKPYIFYHFKKK